MKNSIGFVFLVTALLMASLGCGVLSTPVPPKDTPSPIPPTFTPEPTATATATVIPSPTPLPGAVVLPVDTLGKSIPWLPLDKSARPGTYYFQFNLSKPPFNSALVRQAFAAATDREALVKIAQKYGATNPKQATTFTPSETLGRDLYNEVGIPFNPAIAKDLLAQAGYTDTSNFPPATLMINLAGDAAPGFHVKISDELVKMWQQYLGIKITVEVVADWNAYVNRIDSNPSEMFRLTYYADYNDPEQFLRDGFSTNGQYNYGKFSNSEFDRLVILAAQSNNPAERQELYIQAERLLCETEAILIPIYHATWNIP
jgi:oligopeptide transport system substrate-binding protein